MTKAKEFTYRNISEYDQTITGIGFVEAGKEITVMSLDGEDPLRNPNFELLGKKVAPKKDVEQAAENGAELNGNGSK